MKKINISDITLKKLSENRAVSLLFREKSAIANCADRVGADCVELPAIKNAREDSIIYKTIAKNIGNASLAIPVGFCTAEVETAWECIKDAKAPRLQVELPVSTIQMEYTYHVKQAKMLEKIGELVSAAKALCADVEFSALDATRADEDFLISAARAAEASGANIINLCDVAGASTPDQIADMVKKVKEAVSIPVYVELSDRINMAVASAFAAVKAGADGLKCAMVGKDILLTGEISDALNACGAQIGAEIKLNATNIHSKIEDMVSSINHEAYESESTVSEKKKILLDSDSTLAQVAGAAAILGYELSDSDVGNVYKALKQVCDKKGSVGSKEFEALIASSAMQAPSTYHFESYTTTSSNVSSSMSQVTLKCNDEIICGVSNGDGPIDSAFRAIEQCIGHHYELDDYQVQSVTEGKEALGSALVKLREGGKLYSGNGTSTDIVAASIRAYINALNKIVFEED
jgi:2-isopropylmalate synthase